MWHVRAVNNSCNTIAFFPVKVGIASHALSANTEFGYSCCTAILAGPEAHTVPRTQKPTTSPSLSVSVIKVHDYTDQCTRQTPSLSMFSSPGRDMCPPRDNRPLQAGGRTH